MSDTFYAEAFYAPALHLATGWLPWLQIGARAPSGPIAPSPHRQHFDSDPLTACSD
jgi:hypothetical protein